MHREKVQVTGFIFVLLRIEAFVQLERRRGGSVMPAQRKNGMSKEPIPRLELQPSFLECE
jgi:hypothetical protein